MAFHAMFVPAFEGPGEPSHLARALAFASGSFLRACAGSPVSPAIVAAVRAKPRSESLHRVFGCPLFGFGSAPARFDVLAPDPPTPETGRSLANTEDNQPPLAYFLVGLILRVSGAPSAS